MDDTKLNIDRVVMASHSAAARITDTVPTGLRIARTPDGRERLQAGYLWRQGTSGGTEWRDVPVVDVAE